jgi:hypothetical protein
MFHKPDYCHCRSKEADSLLSAVLIKGKVREMWRCPCAQPPRYEDVWGRGGIASRILNLTVDGGEWSASRPDHFTPGETAPGIHWIGGCVALRARSGHCDEKNPFIAPATSRTSIVQSVA